MESWEYKRNCFLCLSILASSKYIYRWRGILQKVSYISRYNLLKQILFYFQVIWVCVLQRDLINFVIQTTINYVVTKGWLFLSLTIFICPHVCLSVCLSVSFSHTLCASFYQSLSVNYLLFKFLIIYLDISTSHFLLAIHVTLFHFISS